ncbi:MAG: pseudoazurin [Alphaproteobacteria bacterium]|nr:pseudoazurin [Alphaproteobacteria bacterium]
MRATALMLAAGLAAGFPSAAFAEVVEVKQLNAGREGTFVFEPGIVRINIGDFVKFAATDRNHQVTSVRGGIPAKAAAFNSRRNEDYILEFTVPGIYVYECTSHRSLGMIGIVIVGNDTSNLADVKKVDLNVPLANQRLTALVAQIGR